MSESTRSAPQGSESRLPPAAATPCPCEACLGCGGWYRYEATLEPAPGLLYLSCLQCRGSGRTMAPWA